MAERHQPQQVCVSNPNLGSADVAEPVGVGIVPPAMGERRSQGQQRQLHPQLLCSEELPDQL
jgi:hypothetical protein